MAPAFLTITEEPEGLPPASRDRFIHTSRGNNFILEKLGIALFPTCFTQFCATTRCLASAELNAYLFPPEARITPHYQ